MKRVLLVLLISVYGMASEDKWVENAWRLTGESEAVTQRALKALRKQKDLPAKLREGLKGEHRFLALDVITALKLKEFLPELLEGAQQDETGAFYLTINALMDEKTRLKVANLYRKRIFQSSVAPVNRVVMLETLGRFRARLSAGELEALFKEKNHDVRSALLSYLKVLCQNPEHWDLVPLVKRFLDVEDLQLRIQAWWFLAALERGYPKVVQPLPKCAREENPRVRKACRQARKELS